MQFTTCLSLAASYSTVLLPTDLPLLIENEWEPQECVGVYILCLIDVSHPLMLAVLHPLPQGSTNYTFIILISSWCPVTSSNSHHSSPSRGLISQNNWKHLCGCAGPLRTSLMVDTSVQCKQQRETHKRYFHVEGIQYCWLLWGSFFLHELVSSVNGTERALLNV